MSRRFLGHLPEISGKYPGNDRKVVRGSKTKETNRNIKNDKRKSRRGNRRKAKISRDPRSLLSDLFWVLRLQLEIVSNNHVPEGKATDQYGKALQALCRFYMSS